MTWCRQDTILYCVCRNLYNFTYLLEMTTSEGQGLGMLADKVGPIERT